MRKYFVLLAQAVGLGLGLGLCLSGAVCLAYLDLRGPFPGASAGPVTAYYLLIGALLGVLAGWLLALQWVLRDLMDVLVFRVSRLLPLPEGAIGELWTRRVEHFFREVLRPLPGFFGWFLDRFLVRKFKDPQKANRAIEAIRRGRPQGRLSPEGAARVALVYFLEPLWAVFYGTYVLLFLTACFFWSLPFFR